MLRPEHMLPLLPPAAVSRRAAAGARRGAEFGSGLARIGRLEDLAFGARSHFVERRFSRAGAAGAIGQRFRAVHLVEMGFVDAGGCARRPRERASPVSTTPALPTKGRGRRGAAAR